MPTIVLTRHGLTPRSRPEQHLGQRIDIGLSDEGREGADRLAARLASVPFARIVSSPLVRATETAAILAAHASSEAPRPVVETDERLLEMDYGAWEGLTYEQIDARDAEERRRWETDPASLSCPGGESGNDVAARVRALLRDVLTAAEASDASSPTLLVGHSTTNRILLGVALDVPIRDYRVRFVQGQLNLTVLEWRDGAGPDRATVLLLNDLAHLRLPPATPWDD